jgi:hypothetical protein
MVRRRTRRAVPLQPPKRSGIVAVPTILRVGSIDIAINLRDEHEPPHVHVRHPDGSIVVVLDEASNTVSTRNGKGRIAAHEIRRIATIVEDHFERILAAWSFYHR